MANFLCFDFKNLSPVTITNNNNNNNDDDLEGKTGVPGEKPLGAKERTDNKLNPHMASTPGFEPEFDLV